MVKNFLEVLARHTTAGELEKLDPVARKLDVLSQQLVAILSVLDASSRLDLLDQFGAEVLASLKEIEAMSTGSATVLPGDPRGDSTTSGGNSTGPATGTPTPPKQEKGFLAENITPEILEWARQQINVEEALADLREVRETGGLELRDFIQELEQIAARRE